MIFFRPNLREHFAFVNCSMQMRYKAENRRDVAIECLHATQTKSNLESDALFQCAGSKMGNNLLYASALLTDRLVPAKIYVPWVLVDGVHTDEIQERAESDLLRLVCDSYKVPTLPQDSWFQDTFQFADGYFITQPAGVGGSCLSKSVWFSRIRAARTNPND